MVAWAVCALRVLRVGIGWAGVGGVGYVCFPWGVGCVVRVSRVLCVCFACALGGLGGGFVGFAWAWVCVCAGFARGLRRLCVGFV